MKYYHNNTPKIPRRERHNYYNGNGKNGKTKWYNENGHSEIRIDINILQVTFPQSLFVKIGSKPRLQQLREQEERKKYSR